MQSSFPILPTVQSQEASYRRKQLAVISTSAYIVIKNGNAYFHTKIKCLLTGGQSDFALSSALLQDFCVTAQAFLLLTHS